MLPAHAGLPFVKIAICGLSSDLIICHGISCQRFIRFYLSRGETMNPVVSPTRGIMQETNEVDAYPLSKSAVRRKIWPFDLAPSVTVQRGTPQPLQKVLSLGFPLVVWVKTYVEILSSLPGSNLKSSLEKVPILEHLLDPELEQN